MKWNPFNHRIGLALGGGGAKGIAHIGVIKAFEENDIEISYLSGTSIGALVASYYAFGKSVDDIRRISSGLSFTSLIGLSIPKKGIFSTKSIKDMILNDLGDVNIEDADIPLAICTSDIMSGEQVVFRKGSLADAVCASVAVPGIFIPVEINGRTLVDGGITENVPVSPLDRMGAGITVAINLNGITSYQEPKDLIAIMGNAIDIAIDLRTREQLKKADVTLSLDLGEFSRFGNTDEFDKLYKQGYSLARSKISKLFWFKRVRYFFYLKQLISNILPFKIPRVLQIRKICNTNIAKD